MEDNLPKGSPKQIDVEFLDKVLSPRFATAERRKVANSLRDQFMKDPELLKKFEQVLAPHKGDLERIIPNPEELKSFGWTDRDAVACPAAVVAAAAATWGAAAAQRSRV